MTALPTGTVTLLFTDIEGSTRLLEAGPAAYRAALDRHDAIVRRSVADHTGVIEQTRGDGFCAAFASPTDATQAALAVQHALLRESWGEAGPVRVRMALHTGAVEVRGDEYFGPPLHRCARLLGIAHGGQIVLSAVTASLVGETLPRTSALRDLGEHRLRDLVRPERVYQLVDAALPADFPPLRTVAVASDNLPPRATAFIGRERQIAAVRATVLRPDTRLVTLTGPGGTGKTRLAIEVAANLGETFADGVCFVALASVTDPDLVPSAMARALDVREIAGRPILASLQDALRHRQLLLILDNFEQVVEAGPVIAELLGEAPGLTALVTSRAALRLYGEREVAVPPLALPDRRTAHTGAYLAQFEAVRLFVDRAQGVRADLALTDENAADIAEICQRLDGLPLAIELAAARVRALSPRAMLQRMERRLPLLTGGARDLPARQRTLRDAIAWSYDLLDPAEQVLFRRLGVFHGCTLETAEAVCSGEPPRPRATSVALAPLDLDVLDGVESLTEKSLVRQVDGADGQPWYVMLETVREYALERLAESGEAAAVHRRHVLAALELAESSEPGLFGQEQAAWVARLEHEHDNLRAALRWCEASGYGEPALRLGVALWWFWSTHGHVQEGREHLTRLLERFPMRAAGRKTELYARAHYASGMLAMWQGDHTTARREHEAGLALRRASGDQEGVCSALEGLGTAACLQGDYAAARRYLEEAMAIARNIHDSLSYASALNALGNVSYDRGDLEEARRYYAESIAEYSVGDDHHLRNMSGPMLAIVSVVLELGATDEALILARQSLTASREVGNRRNVGISLALLGAVALAQGDHAAAREHLHASIGILRELGDTVGVGQVLERFVELAAAKGRHEGSLQLAGAAVAMQERAGASLSRSSRARLDRSLAVARLTLSPAATDAAWDSGRLLDVDQAVATALAVTAPSVATDGDSSPGPPSDGAASLLTRREQEVAALIARGLTNRQIAEALVITEGTAANHVVHILNKLGYGSRAQVAVWAAEHGLTAQANDE